MKTPILILLAASLCLFALPAAAFECTNAGAGSTAPNDNGFLDRTACGNGANASGAASTAVGDSATSSGFNSTAVGGSATSAGLSSTALGRFASSAGSNSTALGVLASSAGNNSTAVGGAASSAGPDSTALGQSTSAVGNSSTALGYFAASAGVNSTAVGGAASSSGPDSTALGRAASSIGLSSTALGYLALSTGANSTALGSRATAYNDNTMVLGSIPGVTGGGTYVDIANGTTDPLAPLHIFRDDGSAQVLVEETSLDAVPRTLFRLASAGSNAKFEIDNTVAGVNWAFTNSGSDFRISRQGSGVVEFIVDNNGNAFVYNDLIAGGNITGNVNLLSDRKLKQNVQTIDPQAVLEKVAALPVSAWEYTNRPGEQHIGPMAQDFHAAFGLGGQDTSISVVDAAGVALASIQALALQNDALEQRNRDLEAVIQSLVVSNQEQENRLAQLESVESQVADLRALLVQLLPQVAQN